MRAVVQRVANARVEVSGEVVGAIGRGLLVYLGVGHGDSDEVLEKMLHKIVRTRIFANDEGKMAYAAVDIAGDILLVSQFTLYGSLKRGLRPSFEDAMAPAPARDMYERAIERLRGHYQPLGLGVIATGRFGADMAVHSHNDGPVTLHLDSKDFG
jgi:D-tyrosyl-tRNA(Tyr) deacylase